MQNAKNLSPDFIENLRLSYSKRLQRAVIDGQFTILEGSVFEAFDPMPGVNNPWFIDYIWQEHKQRKCILAIDPGFRKSAWIWIHEISPVKWVVVDEMMPENQSTSACVMAAKQRGHVIDEVWCDPAADNTQMAMALDDRQFLQMLPWRRSSNIRYVDNPFRSIEFGVEKLRVLLGDPQNNLPIRLQFASALHKLEAGKQRGIVKDLAALRYPEAKDNRPMSATPVKDGLTDHSTDALRYFAIGAWLTSPLRQIDKELMEHNRAGFRQAA